MPSKPHAESLRKAPLLLASAASVLLVAMLTSCASSDGRLVSATPSGVDLTGEWRLNENLSDDAQHIDEPKDKDLPPQAPAPSRNPGGFGRPGGSMPGVPNGPGGIDPGGGPGENISRAAPPSSGLMPVSFGQDNSLPASSSDSGLPAKPSAGHESAVGHMLDAPQHLTITQSGGKLIVKSDSGDTQEFTAGEQRTIPFGKTEADRSSGWRESAFVVITKAKKGPSKEDDFALDEEGHLIFATLVTHVKKGPIDFKRVYDRVRTPN
jgi:hypothetical protein